MQPVMDIFEYDIQFIALLLQVVLDVILLLVIFFLYKKLGSIDIATVELVRRGLVDAEKRSLEIEAQLRDKEKRLRELENAMAFRASNDQLVSARERDNTLRHVRSDMADFDVALSQKMLDGEIHETVLALWEKGRTIHEIARATGLPDGEVEVIVSIAKTAG